MISVVIPTLNAQSGLAPTLAALVPAALDGLVKEVIVVDGGSGDATPRIANEAGAEFYTQGGGRGCQLIAGAQRARFPWLLFLHADTILEPGWEREAAAFMEAVDGGGRPAAAAAFRLALDDSGFRPRLLERLVALRCALLRLPYGDQALLVPKTLYAKVGGYPPYPLMEDVGLVLRLGRRRIALMRTRAVTSAARYRRDGYLLRPLRNLACLALFFLGAPQRLIGRVYG
ncbi:MAG: TIGR04283 family arsenosugar biosynthesis glycosyltransferase [Hyphomicrobiaceae bacterium]|nr:TIGR04283 family arsenosugar biosynthesis glycosyltransferase [Hyphomicrobiaceae bacterium]